MHRVHAILAMLSLLHQVLERRTHDARAEAQQLRSQLSEAQAKAAEHAGRAKALGTVRAQQDAAAHVSV